MLACGGNRRVQYCISSAINNIISFYIPCDISGRGSRYAETTVVVRRRGVTVRHSKYRTAGGNSPARRRDKFYRPSRRNPGRAGRKRRDDIALCFTSVVYVPRTLLNKEFPARYYFTRCCSVRATIIIIIIKTIIVYSAKVRRDPKM